MDNGIVDGVGKIITSNPVLFAGVSGAALAVIRKARKPNRSWGDLVLSGTTGVLCAYFLPDLIVEIFHLDLSIEAMGGLAFVLGNFGMEVISRAQDYIKEYKVRK